MAHLGRRGSPLRPFAPLDVGTRTAGRQSEKRPAVADRKQHGHLVTAGKNFPRYSRLRKSFLPFHVPEIGEQDVEAVSQALRSGWLTVGPRVREFETRFAQYV